MFSNLLKVLLFCQIFWLTACVGGGNYAPLVERASASTTAPQTYIVSRGETLFSIAWRYGLEFRGLAAANGIAAPYTIYPKQKLVLKSTPSATSNSGTTLARTSSNSSAQVRKNTASKAGSSSKNTVAAAPKSISTQPLTTQWQWPIQGKLLTSFSSASAVHKGIDLLGILGEPVHASNSGEVVYAGSGLVGYGMLLIIKHDEHFLSAYGHNRKLLVKEGDMVKVGQKIAEVGDTGTDRVKLHFEVRRDGKPIDPLTLLKRT